MGVMGGCETEEGHSGTPSRIAGYGGGQLGSCCDSLDESYWGSNRAAAVERVEVVRFYPYFEGKAKKLP